MEWNLFQLGFWHPFGPYCGLTTQEILDWKSREALAHGWTLWSFAYSSTAEKWHTVLQGHDGPVHVLCTASPTATDPEVTTTPRYASHFRHAGETEWQPMPDRGEMYVTNPFKRSGLATAFIVKRVIPVVPSTPLFGVSWYSKSEDRWREDTLPTRGEFLVRRGGKARLRAVCAVLELQPPYLATLQSENVV